MREIKLRALNSSDISKTLEWNNDPEISDFYLSHPFPVNVEMEQKWYQKILTSNIPVSVFGIEHCGDKMLIGLTILRDINLINRAAEYAIYIGDKDYKGKGYSKMATYLTLDFAFTKLGLNRIQLRVAEANTVALGLYKSVGFVEEGRCRDAAYKNGKYRTEILMSILCHEYRREL